MAFTTRATRYDWPLGIGVNVEVFQDGAAVGLIRVLCPADDPLFKSLSTLGESQLFERALASVESRELAQKAIDWQDGLQVSGHAGISPIHAGFD